MFLCLQKCILSRIWGECWQYTQTHTHITAFFTHVCPPHCDRPSRSRSCSDEFEMDVTEVNVCSPEERRFGELRERKEWSVKKYWFISQMGLDVVFLCLDYKNNLLKEKAHVKTQPKFIDLDKGTQTHANIYHKSPDTLFLKLIPSFFLAEMQKFSKWNKRSGTGVTGWSRGCAPR